MPFSLYFMKKRTFLLAVICLIVLLSLTMFSACTNVKKGGHGTFVGCVSYSENNTTLFNKTYLSFSGEQWCTFYLKPDQTITVQASSEEGTLRVELKTDADYSNGIFSRVVEPGKPCSFVYATHGRRTKCELRFVSDGTKGSFYAKIGDKTDETPEGITDPA